MNPSPPDLFPQRPVRSDFGRTPSYRARRIITVLVVTIALVVAYHFIFGGTSLMHSGEIATIKAEGAWKQRPQQPGGLDIPNQNVQVYQALDNKEDAKTSIDHLLPPPEVPQPVPTTVSPSNSAPSVVSAAPQIERLTPPKLEIDNIPAPIADAPLASVSSAPAPPVSSPNVSTEAPAAAPIAAPVTPVAAPPGPPVTANKIAPQAVAVKAKPPAAMTIAQVLKDVKSSSKNNRAVQLASVPDQGAAQTMAEKLQSQYSSVLGTTQLHVVQADIAGKGTFYRIQSSPVSDDRANDICAELKKMKAGCILVRP